MEVPVILLPASTISLLASAARRGDSVTVVRTALTHEPPANETRYATITVFRDDPHVGYAEIGELDEDGEMPYTGLGRVVLADSYLRTLELLYQLNKKPTAAKLS